MGFGGGGGGGFGSETATQSPSPATATDELPSPCPIVATAQLSAVAGSGAAVSQRRAATVVSRAMRDPYTTGSMIHAGGEHAVPASDSPDRAVNGPFVFAPAPAPMAKKAVDGVTTKGFVTFDRTDGFQRQTIGCRPVRTFAGDARPGDTDG